MKLGNLLVLMVLQIVSYSLAVTKPKNNQEYFIYKTANYHEIERGLFLGNARAASDRALLKDLGITHILTVNDRRLPDRVFTSGKISCLYIRAYDSERQQLLPYFTLTNSYIEDALSSRGKVLIHCQLGISRSTTLVAAYLMAKYNISYETALSRIRQKRSFVQPNAGFESQLNHYYRRGFKVNGFLRFNAYLHVVALEHQYKIASAAAVLVGFVLYLIIL